MAEDQDIIRRGIDDEGDKHGRERGARPLKRADEGAHRHEQQEEG